ncbi:hypothetical protein BH09MYX1_BH09MYX1_08260 [soil metagenome]
MLPHTGATPLETVMAQGAFGISYQPIFDLTSGRLFAQEALLRPLTTFAGPVEMLDAAAKEGKMGELGRDIRKIAVHGSPETALFLNAHPHELDEPWLVQPDDPIFAHPYDVYLEITEGTPFRQTKVSHDAIHELARRGVNVVVDDFGAGYSNLRYIADLEPKIVKLDREMLVGIEDSWRVVQLIRGLVRVCEDLGAKVIAEGVETEVQLERLREARVHYVQGFYLGRPSAVQITAHGEDAPEHSGERLKI